MFDFLQEFWLSQVLFDLLLVSILYWLFSNLPNDVLSGQRERSRLELFDFIKGVSILLVVAIHAMNFAPSMEILSAVIWFPVPLFILVSGYLLARRYSDQVNLQEYAKSFILRVVVVYLILLFLEDALVYRRLDRFSEDVIFGLEWGGLYFVPLITQFYIIFPLISRYRKKLTSLPLMLVILIVSIFFWAWNDSLQTGSWNSSMLSTIFFGRFLFFFVFGVYLSRFKLEKVETRKILDAVIAYLLLIWVYATLSGLWWSFTYPVAALFAIILLFRAVAGIKPMDMPRKAVNLLGAESLVIYIVHYRILEVLAGFMLGISDVWRYITCILLTTALSYAIAKVFRNAYDRLIYRIMYFRTQDLLHKP